MMEKVLVWVVLPMLINGFFHEKSGEIYKSPDPGNLLFGYSIEPLWNRVALVAVIPRLNDVLKMVPLLSSRIAVGAPNNHDRRRIFQIDLKDKTLHKLNMNANSPAKPDGSTWHGVTMKAVNDFLMVCEPRYTMFYVKYDTTRILGRCFKITNNWKDFSMMYLPDGYENIIRNARSLLFGWSLETTSDGIVLVGGPGERGYVIKYDSSKGASSFINKDPMQNFGYSITCGNFSKKMSCAVSSTYGTRGYGMIFLYDRNFHKVCVVSDEEHVGILFGAALSKVDLGAGHHHLLVGAPLSRTEINTYDVGAVFLYVKDPSDDTKMVFVKKIEGFSNGGYFGNTIMSLGDMDGDGRDEVAIAAVYENENRGAVYIYSGAVLADVTSDNRPAQVIRPGTLFYFGFSLARVGDFDDNGCNELAVGAPESNTVVVYNSFASVKIDVAVNLINTSRDGNSVTVSFQTCLLFTYPEKLKTVKGDVLYHLQVLNVLYQYDGEVSLDKATQRSCQNHSVVLEETEHQILMYEVKGVALKEDPRTLDDFDPTRVLISSNSGVNKTGQFSISDCGGGVCNPSLEISVETSMPNNEYEMGSSESEWFSMVVSNEGDTAYAPCVEVEVIGATILKPGSCSFRESVKRIVCTPRRALRNDSNWEIGKVLLETSGMTSSDKSLELQYHVFSQCDKAETKQTHALKIFLQRDRMFTITGNLLPDPKVNFTVDEVSSGINRSVSHVYKIQNNGLTNWIGVECKINLPKVEYATYKIHFQSGDVSRICVIDESAWSAESAGSVVCDLGNINRGRSTSVYINIKVSPDLLGLVKKSKETATLTTSLQLLLEGGTLPDVSQSATTTFKLQYAEVALWIIIVSVLVGLLILLVIAFALYKCGFLRRQKRTRLQQLRKSVYRQSVVRSMRQNRQQDCSEDAKRLVSLKEDEIQKEQKDE